MTRKRERRRQLVGITGLCLIGSMMTNLAYGAWEMQYAANQKHAYESHVPEEQQLHHYQQQISRCMGINGMEVPYELFIPGQFQWCFPERSNLENSLDIHPSQELPDPITNPSINPRYEDI